MKRALVDYATSSDDDNNDDRTQYELRKQQPAQGALIIEGPPVTKKRRLPVLQDSLLTPMPIDNPSLHQGRKRTRPHVEGDWPTHVYIPISLSSTRNPKLWALLKRVVADAKSRVPELHSFLNDLSDDASGTLAEIHISLSRPLFLRVHQKDEVKRVVKRIADSTAPFSSSFACFTTFANDEKTRSFLSVEIGAGHAECQNICSGLSSILKELRQDRYHTEPRFHASFAWVLLSPSLSTAQDSSSLGDSDSQRKAFPSVRALPADLVGYLEGEYGAELGRAGRIEVGNVSVKIGKDVSSWALAGADSPYPM